MKKVLILYGSASYEHDVSKLSMQTIKENIDNGRYEVRFCYIDKKHNFYENDVLIDNVLSYLKKFDVIFPIIHGNYGEDGKLEGLLDFFKIKYVGSKTQSSAISFDKDTTKCILKNYGIPQVNHQTLYKGEKINFRKIKFPVIIKPARCGSSIGITVAKNKKELKSSLKEAFKYDDKILIEEFLKVRELECSIIDLNGFKTGNIGEIVSCNDFYDYEAKYEKDSKIYIPANIDKKISKKIKEYSILIAKILEIKNYARVDFLLDEDNNIYFNEINTIPGFTKISMFLKLLLTKKNDIKNIITNLIENV